MNATTTGAMFSTFIGDVGTVLATNLPLVLGVAAGLIGLGILIHYVRKHVGRR